MTKGKHGKNFKTFDELSFEDQARSISGQISVLNKAINAHLRKANEKQKDQNEILLKCIGQLARLIDRISKLT